MNKYMNDELILNWFCRIGTHVEADMTQRTHLHNVQPSVLG